MMKNLIFGLILIGVFAAPAFGQKKTLVINKVEVLPTKADGSSWDIADGAPDLKVRVKVGGLGGASDTTGTKKNTYIATFNEKTVKLKAGDKLTFTVTDEDVLSDDAVGTLIVVITEEVIKGGSGYVTPTRQGTGAWENRIKKITFSFK